MSAASSVARTFPCGARACGDDPGPPVYALPAASAAAGDQRLSRTDSPMPPHPPPRASRMGLVLFWVYVSLYGGFMALVLARPDLLSLRPFGGVNLAIIWGMGLILAAFVLALVFMLLRTDDR